MNEIDFLDLRELDDMDILNVIQQMRHIDLAFHAIKAMFGDGTFALPLHVDKEYIYWCSSVPVKNFLCEMTIVATSYSIRTAGEETVLIIKRIKHSPTVRRVLKERLRSLIHDDDLIIKTEKLKEKIPDLEIPRDLQLWLREMRSNI